MASTDLKTSSRRLPTRSSPGADLAGRSLSRVLLGIFAFVMLSISSGCGPKVVPAWPAGFAPYRSAHLPYHAVSTDGVMFRIRYERNKPRADLPFWKEALKKRMIDAGYHFLSESSLEADGQAGYLLELTAPMGEQDYSFLVTVFVRQKHLVIVESAGEVARFGARHDAVVSAIKQLRF